MDPFRNWLHDFQREVEDVIDASRKLKAGAPPPGSPLSDSVIPPSGYYRELKAAQDRAAELERGASELSRRLAARAAELQREYQRRERLKDLLVKLSFSVSGLDSELARVRLREAETARSLAERLGAARRQREELIAELEGEKGLLQELRAKVGSLEAKLAALEEENLALREELRGAAAEAGSGGAAVKSLETENAGLRSDLQTAKFQIEALRLKAAEAQDDIRTLRARVKKEKGEGRGGAAD